MTAVGAGKLVRLGLQVLGRGGTALPGLVTLAIDPHAIGHLAGSLAHGSVCISGTNGKTTTSRMVSDIVRAAGWQPVHNRSGSNLERGIAAALAVDATWSGELRGDVGVFEVDEASVGSVLARLTPDVLVVTNLFRDQLDRYFEIDALARRIGEAVRSLPDTTTLVLNADDPIVAHYAAATSGQTVFYGFGEPLPGGVGVVDGWITADGAGRVMPLSELRIPGRHNVSNAMAAVSVALYFGIAPDAIRRAAGEFRGVEHRLEEVATIDGVRFVNDSQGTQPDAVIAALRAFEPPVVLIAGGRDKGVDLGDLPDVVAERAAAAVLIGESGPALGRRFADAGLRRVERAETLDDAVELAEAIARASRRDDRIATVLLSPAAASFDMFVDYAERGRAFKAAVARRAARGGRR